MLEKLKEYKNRPVCVFILFLANVCIFIYHNNVFGLRSSWITGINYECVFDYGEFYRIFSAMFSHSGVWHLFMNMMCLWSFGAMVEMKIGSLKMAGIYFLSGLGGSLLSMFGNHMLPESAMIHYSVGASGAIFGLVAADAILWAKEEGKSIFSGILVSFVYVVLSFIGSIRGTGVFSSGRSALDIVFNSGTDVLGHVGGVAAGIAAALLFTRGYWISEKERTACTVLAVFITIVLSVAGGDGKGIMEKLGFENVYLKQVKESSVPGALGITFEDAFESYYSQPSWNIFPYLAGGSIVEIHGIEKKDTSREDELWLAYFPDIARVEPYRLQINGEKQDTEVVARTMLQAVTGCARERSVEIDWDAYWNGKNKYIQMVRTGYPEGVNHVTYGHVLEKYVSSPCWIYFEADVGEKVVQLTGECSMDNRKQSFVLQFLINADGKSFEAYSMSLDGEAQPDTRIEQFLRSIVKNYEG